MESYAIIFKRGGKNKKGEYKMIPADYEKGDVVEKEDGTKVFIIDDKEYRFSSDERSLNDDIVVSFSISTDKLNEALIKAGIDEDSENQKEYVEMLFSAYFDHMCSFSFFQKYDALGRLKNYLFEKPIKQVHNYDENDVLKEFIVNELSDGEEVEEMSAIANEAVKLKEEKPVAATSPKENKRIDVRNLYINVTKAVIGQDKQVQRIIGAINKNQIISNPTLKQNILVTGPTGTGKTEIFRQIARELNLPITIEDATKYTVTGYVGDDVDDMIAHLISNAGGDIKRAERGIIVVDEIDKKADNEQGSKVATGGVLESLLKFMDGDEIKVRYKRSLVSFDTARLTLVASGAFSGLDKSAKQSSPVGFSRGETKDLSKFSTENFERFGILPEFIGRCKTKVILNELSEDDLVKIMLHSTCSPLILNKALFKDAYGIDLVMDEETIREVAKASKELKTNARGLSSIVEEMLSVADFEIQQNPDSYSRLNVYKETVYDSTKYELIRKK